jgi:hypothetical protein
MTRTPGEGKTVGEPAQVRCPAAAFTAMAPAGPFWVRTFRRSDEAEPVAVRA